METSSKIQVAASIITTLSVVTGIVISILSFSASQRKEAESRKIEASKSLIELRQKRYLETLDNAAVLASQSLYSKAEVDSAKRRFYKLYWGGLCLVEDKKVEQRMIAFAKAEQANNRSDTAVLHSSYRLAHAMRESLNESWGIETTK